jgi:hypothetical protein
MIMAVPAGPAFRDRGPIAIETGVILGVAAAGM